MNLRFSCPACGKPARVAAPFPAAWRCPSCERVAALQGVDVGGTLPACVACGNRELYRKKDFPHGLGLAILAFACFASTIAYLYYNQWWTWSILIGSAAVDGLLYLWVKDVVVCYRCDAHYRGLASDPEHKPFELTVYERFRQEQMRRKQLQ